jgi:lipid-binding SYLF domain-containing protein
MGHPVFTSLMSGGIGWQIGAESTGFVPVFKTPRSIEGIMKGQYTLGAEARVVAVRRRRAHTPGKRQSPD